MDFSFNEEQEYLRETARSFLQEQSGSEALRAAMESEQGYDPSLWKQIGSELGWPSVIVPEEYGGIGLSYIELVALMEIMGETLVCVPFFSSICLGANALLAAGSEAQKSEHLPGIAEGSTIATLAYQGPTGAWDAGGIEATYRRDGSDYLLSGVKSFVADGQIASLIVVAARAQGSEGEDGISLFLVPSDAAGLSCKPLPTMDQTRRQAEITLDDVRLPEAARLGEEGAGHAALRETLDRAAIAIAAEQVGGAQKCLDLSVEYAKEREQFGRPIGSFQAIKHKCADMLVEVESARSAAYYAGCIAAQGGEDLSVLASLAKAYCSDAYFHCAANMIQIHGGVGFTWEYDVHLYFKRAKSSETLLGDAAYHRERVARAIGV